MKQTANEKMTERKEEGNKGKPCPRLLQAWLSARVPCSDSTAKPSHRPLLILENRQENE